MLFRSILIATLATLAILVAGALYLRPRSVGGEGPSGAYRLVLNGSAGAVPVGLEVGDEDGATVATLVNGSNRVRAEATVVQGDRLILSFPSYDSRLELALAGDAVTGTAHLMRRTGPVAVPITGARDAGWRFYPQAQPPVVDLAGSWTLVQAGEEGETGVLLLRVAGNRIEGSVAFPSGDVRYLAGEVSGREFALSTFDGNQGSVWRGRIEADGTLAGDSSGPTAKAPTGWTARRAAGGGGAAIEPVSVEQPKVDRIDFSFPDAEGRMVSPSDAAHRGKVVVVAIGGSWCPNCHDEAIFLADYARKRAGEGLAVIGLSFEYSADPVRNARQVKRFADRYRLPYPLLVAGEASKEATAKALPGVGPIRVYPTTLVIDRKGKLREIHVGYAGPATGALHDKAMREFDALVSRLLAEPA